MIDYNKQIVSALSKVLPVHDELALTSKTKVPCISYMELNNADTATGDTLGYSRLTFQIKVWDYTLSALQSYSIQVDKVMRELGFKRISANIMSDNKSTMRQKILTYEALGLEIY